MPHPARRAGDAKEEPARRNPPLTPDRVVARTQRPRAAGSRPSEIGSGAESNAPGPHHRRDTALSIASRNSHPAAGAPRGTICRPRSAANPRNGWAAWPWPDLCAIEVARTPLLQVRVARLHALWRQASLGPGSPPDADARGRPMSAKGVSPWTRPDCDQRSLQRTATWPVPGSRARAAGRTRGPRRAAHFAGAPATRGRGMIVAEARGRARAKAARVRLPSGSPAVERCP